MCGEGKVLFPAWVAVLCALSVIPVSAQRPPAPSDVPPSFHADAVFAAQARALVLSQTQPATAHFPAAAQVFERLTRQLPPSPHRFSWELRIAPQAGNVFSSPDGTIFVDEDLARCLGSQSGLWAAALAHEIEHVVRRDWARRFLYQKSLEASTSAQVTLGGNAAFDSWIDPRTSTSLLDTFRQTQEFEADAEGLVLMARAGYHPAFMPALYHLLEAQPHQLADAVHDATHPLWNERDEKLRTRFAEAGKEFDRLWPAAYSSPGGNPPILVSAGTPSAHRTPASDLEIFVPLHCDNLYGSVEVVLRLTWGQQASAIQAERPSGDRDFGRELHQITGCTSDHTLVVFTLAQPDLPSAHSFQAKVSVLDDRGALLTRTLAPKLLR